ncbi:hypothetical protein GCM10009821_24870 [Aeromicrobium halocynthiae]|uniref:NAD(P)/FAD-dependent oxidoreductase n=1 Tax=Aeromicrobium halocynthiae TaxID=560557 RepID=A0ABN2W3M9_9ACTN
MSLARSGADVVVVGGGHNALVAATLLAREGLDVLVLERLPHVGGAAVSARPFAGLDARLSRYSYLVSLFPQALVEDLGLHLELRSRPTASFTPYERDGVAQGLLVSTADDAATRRSFHELTGDDSEHDAWRAFYREVEELAGVVAATLLSPLPRRSDLRSQVASPIWTDLVERPLGEAIERRFAHDLVRGVVATDALIGTFASLRDPSLVQNRCFLYHLIGNGTGEWRVPVGGMGAVTGELERVARAAGARIQTKRQVHAVRVDGDGVEVKWRGTGDGRGRAGTEGTVTAPWLLSGIAPHALEGMLETPPVPRSGVDEAPVGSQLKVNLLLSRLPALRSGVDPAVAFAGTFHVNEGYGQLEELHAAARRGEAPFAAGELYCHTLTDRSMLGPELAATSAQTLTYFGLHAPTPHWAAPATAPRRRGDAPTRRCWRPSTPTSPNRSDPWSSGSSTRPPPRSPRSSRCPAGTSSTATCPGPGSTTRRMPSHRPDAGVSTPVTTACWCAAAALVAAVPSAASPGTTPPWRCSRRSAPDLDFTPPGPRWYRSRSRAISSIGRAADS